MSRSRMWTEETTTRGSTEDLLPRGNEQGKESTQIYRPKIFFPTSSSSSFFLFLVKAFFYFSPVHSVKFNFW